MDTEVTESLNVESKEPIEQKEQRILREREQLERRLASGELDDVRTRVAFVLNHYPLARNNDVDLTIRYWRIFHPDEVGTDSIGFDALRTITKMTTIVRARAQIQNDYGLFVAEDDIVELRTEREGQMRKSQRSVASAKTPFVYVYSDESGKTDKNYVVGSFWVIDADEQIYKLQRALWDWRNSAQWKSEVHFTEMSRERKDSYLEFVRQAKKSASYVGFKAIVLAKDDVKRRPTEEAIYAMYYRLIVDGIRHEVAQDRFTLPRNVVLYKDEDEGADRLHLHSLKDKLRAECPKQFDNQISMSEVESLKSSGSILMQLADVFTGAIGRIVNRDPNKVRNHKDDAAEEILRILGSDWRELDKDFSRDFVSVIRL